MAKDNFSEQAALYAKYRPHYPEELYAYIFKKTRDFKSAWDCATGNGQVARVLSKKFEQVHATDLSQQQLNQAPLLDNVLYRCASAENPGIQDKVDLITVAQALHWFDPEQFYSEVKRRSNPHTVMAYWGYGLLSAGRAIDPILRHFHDEVMGSYWDPERWILEREYADISFPLTDKRKTHFKQSNQWKLDQLIGYLNSWSSVRKYIRMHGINPVNELQKQLLPLWETEREVTFTFFLTLGKVA